MFRSLQACRAVAALLVVVFHLGATIALAKYSGLTGFALPFAFGHAGVDFFFVLSGFIIVFVHHRDFACPARLPHYLAKRAIRIMPTYWLVFLTVYVIAKSIPALAGTVPDDPLLLLKALLLIPLSKAVVGGTGAPVLVVAWSMQYEVFFYAVIATFIISRRLGWTLTAGLALIGAAGGLEAPFPISFLTAEPWLIEFLFGTFTAWAITTRPPTGSPLLLAILGASSFLLTGAIEVASEFTSVAAQWASHIAYAASSALVIHGLVRVEQSGRIIGGGRGWQLLGAASYMLYLIHFPLISAALKVAHALGLLDGPVTTFLTYLAILALSTAAAVILHLVIEKPLLDCWAARLRSSKRPA